MSYSRAPESWSVKVVILLRHLLVNGLGSLGNSEVFGHFLWLDLCQLPPKAVSVDLAESATILLKGLVILK